MSLIVPFLRLVVFSLPLVHFGASQGVAQQPTEYDPTIFSTLEYRHIGPVGNRVSAVVGVPGDLNVYYIGAASGGVFKSVDGGIHWEPVFDVLQTLKEAPMGFFILYLMVRE